MPGLRDTYAPFLACHGVTAFVGLIDESGSEVGNWPVTVYNVNDVAIGTVKSKQEFIDMWNADPLNQTVGILGGWYGPFSFLLLTRCGITAPEFLGKGGFQGIDHFWIDADGTYVLDFDNTKIPLQ